MRIALTVNFSPWSAYSGGGQRSTHELATALAARGHRLTVVYTRPAWERFPVPEGLPYDIEWAGFFGLRSRTDAWLRSLNAITVARAVGRLIAGEAGTDFVVHAQGEEGALLPRLRHRHPFGFVQTPRYPRYPAGRRLTMPPKFRALGMALRGADRWCPTSESAAVETRAMYGLSDERCTVVPNGVSPAFLSAERKADTQGGPIVFHGRLAPEKGAHTLLEALTRLDGPVPEAVIVGRGPDEARLESLAKEHALAVRFAGWQSPEALAGLLAGARLSVLPSLEESFGNAMVEAMAVGAPLVSTRAGSVPEVVPAGAGVLVEPEDPAALADAIAAQLADPAASEAMGQRGREVARARYSWDATAAAFEAIYEATLQRAPSG